MKELNENLKCNLKLKFLKFGTQPGYEAPGDPRVKIDKHFQHLKNGKYLL